MQFNYTLLRLSTGTKKSKTAWRQIVIIKKYLTLL